MELWYCRGLPLLRLCSRRHGSKACQFLDMAPAAKGTLQTVVVPASLIVMGAIQPMMIKLYVRLISSDANDSWRLRLKHPWMPHKHAV